MVGPRGLKRIILASRLVRISRMVGFEPSQLGIRLVPKVGITGSIGLSLAVGLLGHTPSDLADPTTPPVPASRTGQKTKIGAGGTQPPAEK